MKRGSVTLCVVALLSAVLVFGIADARTPKLFEGTIAVSRFANGGSGATYLVTVR
jgi:hypothetical protein